MKLITCAGYYRTGSSAVTDFFSEFNECESLGNCEFRFAQDPDGISSLEYNIIENNHRHNSSHAIKRFLRYSKFENGNIFSKRYRKYFGTSYMSLTNEYIRDLTGLCCKTMWRYDKIEYGNFFYMLDTLLSVLYGKIYKNRRLSMLTLFGEKGYYTDIPKEEFYRVTKKYTSALFQSANKNNAEYMMVDQLVPPSNIGRYRNYFDDLYVVVVDRDPRDLYILEHTYYRWGIIPQDNVKEFCDWYKITRSHRNKEYFDDKTKFIYLEDLIYNYEKTSKELMQLVGISEEQHTRKYEYFNPEKSAKGTKLWLRYPELSYEINYIEKELYSYLYLHEQL